MFGATRIACGNYKNLSVASAKAEARRYLDALNAIPEVTFRYEE
jgi:S-ribosylhomocysteine lyase LuxS involved in autoinducer biosynthesis